MIRYKRAHAAKRAKPALPSYCFLRKSTFADDEEGNNDPYSLWSPAEPCGPSKEASLISAASIDFAVIWEH